jgi:hypothetical protein
MSDKKLDVQQTLMTRTYRDRESAERAYDDLITRGFKPNDIHVVMTDETRKRLFTKGDSKADMGNKALEGVGVGGVVGGVIGATVMGLAAAAATVTVPILGLVIVGPLAGAVAGVATGAATGGFVGMLVGAGIPEDRAKAYEKELNDGSILLGVTPRDDNDARYFENAWQGQTARG